MIDSKGVEYGAYGAVFGGSESSTSNLIQDVGARAEIVFEEVPTEVNQLTLIELSVYVEEIEETFVVQFRNISILS